jgi:hypothetical protein
MPRLVPSSTPLVDYSLNDVGPMAHGGIRQPITRVDGCIEAYIYEHEVIIVAGKLDF